MPGGEAVFLSIANIITVICSPCIAHLNMFSLISSASVATKERDAAASSSTSTTWSTTKRLEVVHAARGPSPAPCGCGGDCFVEVSRHDRRATRWSLVLLVALAYGVLAFRDLARTLPMTPAARGTCRATKKMDLVQVMEVNDYLRASHPASVHAKGASRRLEIGVGSTCAMSLSQKKETSLCCRLKPK